MFGVMRASTIRPLIIFFLLLSFGEMARASLPALRAVTAGSTITISTSNLQWQFPVIRRNGKSVMLPSLPYLTGTARPMRFGAPDLPFLTAMIAVPNGGVPRIEILDQQSTLRTVDNLAIVDTGTGAARPVIAPANAFWPASIAEVGAPSILRGMHVVRVQIFPLQYNPTTHQLRVYSSIRIALHVSGSGPSAQSIAPKESHAWNNLASSLLLNYKDAQQWRARPSITIPSPKRILSAASARVKVGVKRNGIYRITGADLDTVLGALRSTIVPRTMHLYLFHPDTIEIPIRLTGADDGSFDLGDTLEFAGTMHYGEEGDYYDDYTDENSYWLLWDDPSPQKLYRNAPSGGGATPVTGYSLPEHFERDIEAYPGDDSSNLATTIFKSEKVAGERFYWTIIDPINVPAFNYPFVVGGIPDDPSPAVIRVHMRGFTSVGSDFDHDITIELNNVQIGETQFQGWGDTVVTITMPCKKLMAGPNLITVRSKPTAQSINQVGIDYIDVVTPRQTVFAGDSMYVALDAGVRTMTFQNSRSPQLTLYDPASSTIPVRTATVGGTFVRVESRGGNDTRFMRMEVQDSIMRQGPYERGVTIMVLDSATGAVRDVKRFDTWAATSASTDLANYCATIPRGMFVLMAVCDDAATQLTDTARKAIRALGATKFDRVDHGDSWAFVCRAGDPTFIPVEDYTPSGTGAAHVTATLPTTTVRSWSVTFRDSARSGSAIVAQVSASIGAPHLTLRHATSLRDPSHRADYIVITHRSLASEAHRLAAFRADHDHYDTAVVDVEDIYDEFNGGIEREVPIKDFLRMAYTTWKAPAPSIVVLFGDGTWDPKHNTTGAWRRSLIPTFGRPVSDYWYTLLEGDDMLPEMVIGRIAVPTLDTARAVVDKIISYASQGPQRWNKNFMFVSGGMNLFEEYQMQVAVQSEARFILPPPICANIAYIQKANTDQPIDPDQSREITQRINNGLLWFTYLGHAAANIFEVTIDSPNVFQNQGRLPFFSAYSCQTGAFAEPRVIAADEQYVNEPEKGYIGAWGITGFGELFTDIGLMSDAYQAFGDSSLRKLGMLTTAAKMLLWGAIPTNQSQTVVNTIMQYALIGDPATELALRTHPDVEITDSDITVIPVAGIGASATDLDSNFVLLFTVHNNGLSNSDSVRIRIHDAFSGGTIDTDIVIPMPCQMDSERIAIPVHRVSGEHLVTITLDPDKQLTLEEDRSNNVAHRSVFVLSSVLTVLNPGDNGSMTGPCGPNSISILVPQFGASALQYFLEIDSSNTFVSPLAKYGPIAAPAGPILHVQIGITLSPGRAYYWRARTLDPSLGVPNPWLTSSFIADGMTWDQRFAGQFSNDARANTNVQADGVHLGGQKELISIESRTYNDPHGIPAGVRLQIGNQLPYVEDRVRGMHVFLLSDTAVQVENETAFETWSTDSDSVASRNFAQYINDIPVGRTVILAVGLDGSTGLTTAGKLALRALGAQDADSIISFATAYVLIGRKGATPGTVPETFKHEGGGPARLSDSVDFEFFRGSVTSPLIGAASHWSRATATLNVPSSTDALIKIYGQRHDTGKWDSLGAITPSQLSVDLSNVDASFYRRLKMLGQLSRTDIFAQPVLNQWGVSFTHAPELFTFAPTVSIVPDTVLEGETPVLSGEVWNGGCVTARQVKMRVQLQASGVTQTAATGTIDSIAPQSFVRWSAPLSTAGARGVQSVLVTVDPTDTIGEILETNNTILSSLRVRKDTTPPTELVTVDGRQILNGDIVGPNPEIIVRMFDVSPLPLRDPKSITLMLDSTLYSVPAFPTRMTIDTNAAGGVKAKAVLHPLTLSPGEHEVRVYATDATGNSDETYDRTFVVMGESSVDHVMNAPNPFAHETYFTFQLGGLEQPVAAKVKIYSVAGRLLRVIETPGSQLRIGFNTIAWDGTDEEGAHLSNGVYIYKMIVQLPTGDLVRTEKLAVLR